MNITKSQRLSYRLLTADDAELLADLDSDPLVMKYINGGEPNSLQTIQEVFVPRLTSFTNENNGWGLWGCFDNTDSQFLGWILVRPMDFFNDRRNDKDLELGWRFKRCVWGKGYATEAANHIMMELPKLADGIEAFSAIALEDNAASINIMKKLSMTFVKKGTHRDPLGDLEVVYYRRPVAHL
ncbi:GNAT family N-acetyltransferase [Pseudoalteromonas sp. T1lg65]|uniref:GNAT family N-acetyltransferase n=1 Tax=Pseudoalteromonas sp. T1lg65 TaxID=2077101 RepID=UPI003F799771